MVVVGPAAVMGEERARKGRFHEEESEPTDHGW